jgi:hypothetical protein
MDAVLVFCTVACGLICTGSTVVIMHPRIHEGLILRLGLVLLSLGSFALGINLATSIDLQPQPLLHAIGFCLAGAVIVGLGIARRLYADPHMRELAQRVSGWGDLDGHPGTQ